MKMSLVVRVSELPKDLDFESSFLIYDQILEKQNARWIRKFPNRIAVKSGEDLKQLRNFSMKMEIILRKTKNISRERLSILALGGGSVGDFSGFVASTLRRGVRLVQIPSTWLAAMDSAHGGKTALNVGEYKNQIGTFYPAEKIYLVKKLLIGQPPARVHEAAGEYYKMQFLNPKLDLRKLKPAAKLRAQDLWRDLNDIIALKWKIVKQDPYEKKGLRHTLNLGHTVGHVLEGALGIPHGKAVHLGLRFAWDWSVHDGLYQGSSLVRFLPGDIEYKRVLRQLKNPLKLLERDKKMAGPGQIRFIFLKKLGYPDVHLVPVKEIAKEWRRQSR